MANENLPDNEEEAKNQMENMTVATQQDYQLGAARNQVQGAAQSQVEQAKYQLKRADDERQRAARAVQFFVKHPEFDEFIQLVRAGVIQIL